MKPEFVKRKRTNKLEPQAVPCFYVGPSPNHPRDSIQVMFSSGTMIDSRDVTWASILHFASILCEQGGQEPTELQEMESVEGETNPSDGESDELQSDRQKSAGDEEHDDDEESIFPLVVDPAPTRVATPVGRAAQSMTLATTADAPLSIGRPTKTNSQPIEVESPERINNSNIGVGDRTLLLAPHRPHQGRTSMAPCLRLCWAGGKRADSSGQRQVQLALSMDARVWRFSPTSSRPKRWSPCWRGWPGICA